MHTSPLARPSTSTCRSRILLHSRCTPGSPDGGSGMASRQLRRLLRCAHRSLRISPSTARFCEVFCRCICLVGMLPGRSVVLPLLSLIWNKCCRRTAGKAVILFPISSSSLTSSFRERLLSASESYFSKSSFTLVLKSEDAELTI